MPGRQGHVSIDYVGNVVLSEVLQIVAKKRRYPSLDGLTLSYLDDKTPLALTLTLEQLKDKVVQLHVAGEEEEVQVAPRKGTKNKYLHSLFLCLNPKKKRFSEFFKIVNRENAEIPASKMIDGKGWLTKEGGRIKTWKRRWMVLKNKSIYYAPKQVVVVVSCLSTH